MLSLLRNWLEILRSAYSSWAATIGTIIATVALCNIAFRAMDASLAEVFKWILAAYQKTFHPPIAYLLSLFSISLPSPAKDLLVLYLAMGGVLYRTLAYDRPSPMKDRFPKSWQGSLRIQVSRIFAALLWPYFLRGVIRHPCFLVISRHGYHGRLPPPRRDLPSAERKKVIETLLGQIGNNARVICNERQLLALYTAGLIAAVGCLVALNAAIDGLSEKFSH